MGERGDRKAVGEGVFPKQRCASGYHAVFLIPLGNAAPNPPSATTGCGKASRRFHPEPFAVILSAAKNLALSAPRKLRAGLRHLNSQANAETQPSFHLGAASPPQDDSRQRFSAAS